MRKREEITSDAGPNKSIDQLHLEVLLDIRDLLDSINQTDSQPETVDVQVTAPKKGLTQKTKG